MSISFEEILALSETSKERISELLELIQDAKQNEAELINLNAESVKSEYKLWQNIFATLSYISDQSAEEKKTEIDEFSASRYGISPAWLDKKLREFQYGDSLELDSTTGLPYYATIDESKQIIKRVAIVQGSGFYTAKVAGEDDQGNTVAFNTSQLTAIESYLDDYIVGNNGVPESKNADYLKAEYNIYFNAIETEQVVRPLVESAINNYLSVLQTSDFGGSFHLSKLEDAIQSVSAVDDFERINIEARTNSGSFITVSRIYQPDAGYMDIDPTYPLNTSLNFIAV